MQDVITIGSATRDVFLFSDKFQLISSPTFETGTGECVSLGTKIELDRIVCTTGGGATNAAVTFARLGFKAAAVCLVGDDSAGRDILLDLKKERVGTSLIRTVPKGETAYSTLLTAPGGERTVLIYRGVSADFRTSDIPWTKTKAKWFYVTSLAGNLSLFEKILRHAKAIGASVAWNPGSQEIAKGFDAFKKLLPLVHVLNFNREEAERLTGKKEIGDILALLATAGNVAIITDGERGAYAHKDGKTLFAASSGVVSVSRTGAGDAFGSGFVAGLMKTGSLETSLAIATLNAESVIQKIGARAGILKRWPSKKDLTGFRIQ